MNVNYSLGEIRKTVAAAVVLVPTLIGYVLADDNLRGVLPPKLVLVFGAIAAVFAVFKTPNAAPAPSVATAPDDVQRAIDAVNAAKDHAGTAVQNAQDLEAVLRAATGGLAPVASDVVERVIAVARAGIA